MAEYSVVVGNIGTVYQGKNKRKALELFTLYVEDSRTLSGRSGGQDVYIISGSDILEEFFGEYSPKEEE